MNLVAGGQLAWQERRAAAFALTPLTCGYGLSLPDDGSRVEHYRPSTEYMGGIWIGSAMAISGAAASPNMGYHSSPALTFLMTVFNARLGHWSPNPVNDKTWTRHDPPFGGAYLIRELLGETDLGSPYVYLSDGGHFENLGIYELVRRRCACVVAIDAGQDQDSTFEDLGNAIRKCYADFGVTIEVCTTTLANAYYVGRAYRLPGRAARRAALHQAAADRRRTGGPVQLTAPLTRSSRTSRRRTSGSTSRSSRATASSATTSVARCWGRRWRRRYASSRPTTIGRSPCASATYCVPGSPKRLHAAPALRVSGRGRMPLTPNKPRNTTARSHRPTGFSCVNALGACRLPVYRRRGRVVKATSLHVDNNVTADHAVAPA